MKKIIVSFHIGRGGRFYNQGHVSFIGEQDINDFVDDLFIRFENEPKILSRFSNNQLLNAVRNAIADEDYDTLVKFAITKEDLGQREYYCGASGSSVGLLVDNDGTGRINIDNDYNTTYSCFIEDCSENDIRLIHEYTGYKSRELEDYIKENYPELFEEEE
jgi:hypothetical protein